MAFLQFILMLWSNFYVTKVLRERMFNNHGANKLFIKCLLKCFSKATPISFHLKLHILDFTIKTCEVGGFLSSFLFYYIHIHTWNQNKNVIICTATKDTKCLFSHCNPACIIRRICAFLYKLCLMTWWQMFHTHSFFPEQHSGDVKFRCVKLSTPHLRLSAQRLACCNTNQQACRINVIIWLYG